MKVSRVVIHFLDKNVVELTEGHLYTYSYKGFGHGAVQDLHLVIRDTVVMVNFLIVPAAGEPSKRINYAYPLSTIDSVHHI